MPPSTRDIQEQRDEDAQHLEHHVTPEEAAREIERDFLRPEQEPLPRAPNDAERRDARRRIQFAIEAAVIELARSDRGVSSDDVYDLARTQSASVLLGSQQRAWSWTGPWLAVLARAGVLRVRMVNGREVTRRSTREGTHGTPQTIYEAADRAPLAGVA